MYIYIYTCIYLIFKNLKISFDLISLTIIFFVMDTNKSRESYETTHHIRNDNKPVF